MKKKAIVNRIGNRLRLSKSAVLAVTLIFVLLFTATIAIVKAETYTFVLKWGEYGSGDGQFNFPGGVAVDGAGNVYVLDNANHRVQKFTSTGTFITKWGSLGSGDGQFNFPSGIAFDGEGNVYVADYQNHRVQKFTSTGTFITKWGSYGNGEGQFDGAVGIAVDDVGNVYVVDYFNQRVQKFTSGGGFVTMWGGAGFGDGQFWYPISIAVDGAGNVYVTDIITSRVQKFTSTGTFITKWGSLGSGDGQFNYPSGIAFDGEGNVYVTDICNARFQEFTSTGTFITKWGSLGSGDGQFQDPVGIAFDNAGNLYVTDSGNNRVQKYQPPNSPPVADAGSSYSGTEGSLIVFDALASTDPDADTLQYRWDFKSDETWTSWSSSATATYSWNDDWSGIATLEVTDGEYTSSATSTVTIINVAPTINTVAASPALFPIGTAIETNGIFTDPATADTHTAVWSWGDQQTSSGTFSSGTVIGSHTYSSTGVYTLALTVTDDDGAADTEVLSEYVVVYDPASSFVTGGGWIDSPKGAYRLDPTLAGKATFGFVSKYQKGATVPKGNTEFQLHVAGMNFKSTSYDWLVVAGTKAQYKGTGTINGQGNYGFMLTAVDGGTKSSDTFRIKIWDKATDTIIYDNDLGSSETADLATTIAGGNIKI